jgi:hypothetical protein
MPLNFEDAEEEMMKSESYSGGRERGIKRHMF